MLLTDGQTRRKHARFFSTHPKDSSHAKRYCFKALNHCQGKLALVSPSFNVCYVYRIISRARKYKHCQCIYNILFVACSFLINLLYLLVSILNYCTAIQVDTRWM